MNTDIPIVDLGGIHRFGDSITPDDPDCISTAEAIRDGLGAVGFLYLTNHGIPDETVSQVFTQSEKLFSLPSSTKLKYKKDTSSKDKVQVLENYYGYVPRNGEKLHPSSTQEIKETFDWLNIEKEFTPSEVLPEFDPHMKELDVHCKRLLKKIFKLLAIGLHLDDVNFFVNTCRYFDYPAKHRGIYDIRLIHYPPISQEEPYEEGSVRCGEHSDYGFLTLLFQDDIGGLEVKTVDGKWVHAEPVPGSIILNTGDLTEFWTCGVFPATPHRVVLPDVDDSRRSRSRYSIACFNGPDCDTIITPIDVEKTPRELERLAKNGKVYSKDPVNAYSHMFGRVATQYGYS